MIKVKGTMNRSSICTSIECTTLMEVLAKMPDSATQSALDGFSEALSAGFSIGDGSLAGENSGICTFRYEQMKPFFVEETFF